jgi:hypothetical protein
MERSLLFSLHSSVVKGGISRPDDGPSSLHLKEKNSCLARRRPASDVQTKVNDGNGIFLQIIDFICLIVQSRSPHSRDLGIDDLRWYEMNILY